MVIAYTFFQGNKKIRELLIVCVNGRKWKEYDAEKEKFWLRLQKIFCKKVIL